MVAPITGPFVTAKNEQYSNTAQYRYHQSRPYDLPLPYYFEYDYGTDRLTSSDDNGSYDSGLVKNAGFSAFTAIPSNVMANCYNRAYEKLRGQLSDTAGWSENIAQAHQARKMFNDRASQLLSFTKRLYRRDFSGAARALRTPIPSGVSNRKAISQNFLEFHFGWEPLVNDLSSSLKVLAGDPGRRRISGSASEPVVINDHQVVYDPGGVGYTNTFMRVDLRTHLFTFVTVSNPNLFLANQLGLLDLALPWKLVPFSFLVDWFVNVEQMISSISDWFGCTLDHPGTTVFAKGIYLQDVTSIQTIAPHLINRTWRNQNSTVLWRQSGISGPSLIVKPFKGLSIMRGATALALVLSVLGK